MRRTPEKSCRSSLGSYFIYFYNDVLSHFVADKVSNKNREKQKKRRIIYNLVKRDDLPLLSE